MEKIERINNEIQELIKLLYEKRKEVIKQKLQFLSENEDNENAHLTEEEWEILKEFLIARGDCKSVKMQHSWYEDVDGYNTDDYETIIRVANKYISIHSGMTAGNNDFSFNVSDHADIQVIDGFIKINGIYFVLNEFAHNWYGTEKIISGKDELTENLNIGKLFEEEMVSRQEFEESLLREDVVEYYLSKTPEELEEFGPEVSRMVGFEQKNAHHCYDLWEHTLHTVESIDTRELTEEQAKKIKVAAFFHDIGKPDVVGFNPKTQQQNFINHAVHSVEVARTMLEKLGYSMEEIKQLSFYIAHHDDFLNYKSTLTDKNKFHAFFRDASPEAVTEIVIQNQIDWDKLGIPCYLPTHTADKMINEQNEKANSMNKIKQRYICSTLARGVEPTYKDYKNNPIKVDVDMDDIITKLSTGEYNAEYIPTEEDYKLLLEICKADARAQSEKVYSKDMRTGEEIVTDTRERKVTTMEDIGNVISIAYEQGTDIITEITNSVISDQEDSIDISTEE